MEKLHPGTRWAFRLNFYFMFLGLIVFLVFFSFTLIFRLGLNLGLIIFSIFILGLVFILILGEIFARLAYNNWKFEFAPKELKIERGIIWKVYKSIPYERVQNIEIHRGILARILGYSAVDVQTAGYSMSPRRNMSGAEGFIPGVSISRAEEIREFIMKKVSGKNSGL